MIFLQLFPSDFLPSTSPSLSKPKPYPKPGTGNTCEHPHNRTFAMTVPSSSFFLCEEGKHCHLVMGAFKKVGGFWGNDCLFTHACVSLSHRVPATMLMLATLLLCQHFRPLVMFMSPRGTARAISPILPIGLNRRETVFRVKGFGKITVKMKAEVQIPH